MNKPVVRYLRTKESKGYSLEQYMGIPTPQYLVAYINHVLDHPRLGETHVRTSTVLSDADGVIETRNTIYVPVYDRNEAAPTI